MSELNVLLVEDDIDLAKTIVNFLKLEGIACDHALNGQAGLNFALEHRYHVILLDVNLPRMSGLEVCESLRTKGLETPVLMLTARDALADKLAGFDVGTDDYVVKPFLFEELVARTRALAHRRSSRVRMLSVADLSMDSNANRVKRAGHELALTPITWKILEALLRASPNLVSKAELIQEVWGDEPPDSSALKVHLHKLRQIVDKPFASALVHTIPNKGVAIREEEQAC